MTPLTYAQQAAWLAGQLDPLASRRRRLLRLQGPVDVDALRASLAALLERHAALRTSIVVDGAAPIQRPRAFNGDAPLTIRSVAFSAPPDDAKLGQVIAHEAGASLDIEVGRAFALTLFPFGPNDHALLVEAHTCASDGPSLNLAINELFALYAAATSGGESHLHRAGDYSDYAEREQRHLDDGDYERHIAFWRRQLNSGDTSPFAIPPDRARAIGSGTAAASFDLEITAELAERMRALGQACRATPYMCWLAVLAAVASRHASRSDVRVATPIEGRPSSELAIVGCFSNVLTMRVDIDASNTFRDVLRRTQSTTLAALRHRDAPFQHVVRALGCEPSLGSNPFTTLGYMHRLGERPTPSAPSLDVRELRIGDTAPMPGFDLAVVVLDSGSGPIICRWSYATAVYDEITVRQVANDFLSVTRRAVDDPDSALALFAPTDENGRVVGDFDPDAEPEGEHWIDEQVALARAVSLEASAPGPSREEIGSVVSEIWKSVLDRDEIDDEENFFEIGGHSLRAVQVVVRVRKHFDIDTPLGALLLLEHPTLAAFTSALAEILSPTGALPSASEAESPLASADEPSAHAPLQIGRLANASGILLTGATGFVGVHVLYELLRNTNAPVRCLVRAADDETAWARLQERLDWYFPGQEWQDYRDRLSAIAGDVSSPGLGLDRAALAQLGCCEHVIHAAADVRAIAPIEELTRANVDGTRHLLDLAHNQGAVFHHVSTLDVHGSLESGEAVWGENDFDINQVHYDPYSRSKFEAERQVRDYIAAGGTATILRVTHAAPHSVTGRFQRNIDDHGFARFIRAIVELGVAPFSLGRYFNLVPVDTMARAIVCFAGDPAADNETLHVDARYRLSYVELVRVLQAFGYGIRFLDETTITRVVPQLSHSREEEIAVGRLLSVLDGGDLAAGGTIRVNSARSALYLSAHGLDIPKLQTEWFERFVEHCIAVDYLPAPRYPLGMWSAPEVLALN